MCTWEYEHVFGAGSRQYLILFLLFTVVELLVPFVAVIASCVLSWLLLTGAGSMCWSKMYASASPASNDRFDPNYEILIFF